jgi:rhodanese-related sulfurtransferase
VKQFLEFVIHHWILWSIFVLIILVIIFEEIRGRIQGIARLTPHDLTRLINREEAVAIDVRDNAAFAKGHIIGSINIPHTKMDGSIDKLKKYQQKPVVIVSSNGQTGPQEGVKLQHNGFNKVYFLAGGIAAWQEAGLPLIKD